MSPKTTSKHNIGDARTFQPRIAKKWQKFRTKKDRNGRTLLHYSCRGGNMEITDILGIVCVCVRVINNKAQNIAKKNKGTAINYIQNIHT